MVTGTLSARRSLLIRVVYIFVKNECTFLSRLFNTKHLVPLFLTLISDTVNGLFISNFCTLSGSLCGYSLRCYELTNQIVRSSAYIQITPAYRRRDAVGTSCISTSTKITIYHSIAVLLQMCMHTMSTVIHAFIY